MSGVPRPCLSAFWRDRAGIFITTDYLYVQTHPLPFSGCLLGLDFHHALDPGNAMLKATPGPILRTCDQSSLHRIAVYVAQLLNPFVFVPHVDVIVTSFPERAATGELPELVRNVLLEHLNRDRRAGAFRLADEQVNVLRHDDIPGHVEFVPYSHPLQGLLEGATCFWRGQQWGAAVATESDEVQIASLLKTLQSPRRGQEDKPESGGGAVMDEYPRKPPPCLSKERKDKDGAPREYPESVSSLSLRHDWLHILTWGHERNMRHASDLSTLGISHHNSCVVEEQAGGAIHFYF